MIFDTHIIWKSEILLKIIKNSRLSLICWRQFERAISIDNERHDRSSLFIYYGRQELFLPKHVSVRETRNDFDIAPTRDLREDEIDNWSDSRKQGMCLRRLELALVKRRENGSRTRRYRYSDDQNYLIETCKN